MPLSPHRFGLSVLALTGLLGTAGLAFALWPRQAPAAQTAARPASAVPTSPALMTRDPRRASTPQQRTPDAPAQASSPFQQLRALQIENQTSRETRELLLYDAQGQIDEAAARELDDLLCDAREAKHHESTRLNRRTLQLLFKAAYHFESYQVEVVSAYRKPGRRREGPHGAGDAVDFRLRGVSALELASYLRAIPRTGVGVYTHPKTQFVHLDSREHSFHWLDASPPRRHWREKSIGSRDLPLADQRYTEACDLPERLSAQAAACVKPSGPSLALPARPKRLAR